MNIPLMCLSSNKSRCVCEKRKQIFIGKLIQTGLHTAREESSLKFAVDLVAGNGIDDRKPLLTTCIYIASSEAQGLELFYTIIGWFDWSIIFFSLGCSIFHITPAKKEKWRDSMLLGFKKIMISWATINQDICKKKKKLY